MKKIHSALFGISICSINVQEAMSQQQTTELGPIVVTASTTSQTSEKDAPASVSVIAGTNADKYQAGQDILDMLKGVAGVNTSVNSNGARNISIRGLSHDYTLVLQNGNRDYSGEASPRGNESALAKIPNVAIDRLEVIRGPMSSIYGSDAMGGVVNVITRENSGETEGAVSFDYKYDQGDKDGDGSQVGFYLSTPISDSISWTSYGNWLNFDQSFYKNNQDSDYTKRREQKNFNLSSEVKWAISDTKELKVKGDTSKQKTLSDKLFRGRRSAGETETNEVTVNYQQQFGSTTLNTKAFYENYKVESYSNPVQAKQPATKQNTWGGDVNVNFNLADNNITIGGYFEQTKLKNQSALKTNKAEKAYQKALYAEANIPLDDSLILTLGARYDDHEVYGDDLSPRLYLVKTLSPHWTIKGGISQAFKAPKMVEYSSNYSGPGCALRCTIYGNPNVKAEKGTFSEFSVAYDNGDTTASLTVFNNNIKDMITLEAITRERLTYSNIGRANTRGVELSLSQNIGDNVQAGLSYTYLDAKNKDTNKFLDGVSRHEATANVDWFVNDNMELFSRLNFIGKHQGLLNSGLDHVGSYSTVDIGGRYNFHDLSLKFGVNNIGNKEVSSPSTFTEVLNGRTYYVGLTKEF